MSATNFEKSLHKHMGSLIQGNILPTIELIQSVDLHSLTETDIRNREAYVNRFIAANFPEHPDLPDFIQALLQIYYQYWQRVLMQVDSVETAEASLCKSLNRLLLKHEQIKADVLLMDKLEEIVIRNVEELGFGILMDVTRPYRECIIWKSQTKKQYEVNFHDTKSSLEVTFLDDFISFGWIGFASLNKIHTGGWATFDGIYRVGAPPEDETDENFHLDILCHEGRHFSDYIHFPKLKQPELEYRAKLTELCHAHDTLLRRIQHYLNTSSPDKDSAPHTYSAYYVMRDLSLAMFSAITPPPFEKWQALDIKEINTAAAGILYQNNIWLQANHPEKIESFLGLFEFHAVAVG